MHLYRQLAVVLAVGTMSLAANLENGTPVDELQVLHPAGPAIALITNPPDLLDRAAAPGPQLNSIPGVASFCDCNTSVIAAQAAANSTMSSIQISASNALAGALLSLGIFSTSVKALSSSLLSAQTSANLVVASASSVMDSVTSSASAAVLAAQTSAGSSAAASASNAIALAQSSFMQAIANVNATATLAIAQAQSGASSLNAQASSVIAASKMAAMRTKVIALAVVVSVVGVSLFSVLGYIFLVRYKKRKQQLKLDLQEKEMALDLNRNFPDSKKDLMEDEVSVAPREGAIVDKRMSRTKERRSIKYGWSLFPKTIKMGKSNATPALPAPEPPAPATSRLETPSPAPPRPKRPATPPPAPQESQHPPMPPMPSPVVQDNLIDRFTEELRAAGGLNNMSLPKGNAEQSLEPYRYPFLDQASTPEMNEILSPGLSVMTSETPRVLSPGPNSAPSQPSRPHTPATGRLPSELFLAASASPSMIASLQVEEPPRRSLPGKSIRPTSAMRDTLRRSKTETIEIGIEDLRMDEGGSKGEETKTSGPLLKPDIGAAF